MTFHISELALKIMVLLNSLVPSLPGLIFSKHTRRECNIEKLREGLGMKLVFITDQLILAGLAVPD